MNRNTCSCISRGICCLPGLFSIYRLFALSLSHSSIATSMIFQKCFEIKQVTRRARQESKRNPTGFDKDFLSGNLETENRRNMEVRNNVYY